MPAPFGSVDPFLMIANGTKRELDLPIKQYAEHRAATRDFRHEQNLF